MTGAAEELFARWVERLVVQGERLDPAELCRERPDLLEPVQECIRQYDELALCLDNAPAPDRSGTGPSAVALPEFEGFRTIERIGRGGGGNVYKVQDLTLGRIVAAKTLRSDHALRATVDDFLREARSLALFEDPRIVRLFELRDQADPPTLIMEYVDGFELSEIGPALEYGQRARVVAEVAEAIHRAHRLGIQHRDLKPANILLDARLQPKILDFGLSRGERLQGHGAGTLEYMAPEQLDPARPIDARTDVYALGVVLYELLCGTRPFHGETEAELVRAIFAGEAALPVEIEPQAPEPLQAIALKAMEREPSDRYASALEMALDLRRFLDGQPVTARPKLYQSALGRRLRPHLEQIREWLRIKLLHPHEAERLLAAYKPLEDRTDDWIALSRVLSFSQIALYFGAFLMVGGGLLLFYAHVLKGFTGLLQPTLTLGLPFAGLTGGAFLLWRRDRRPVAVAFFLAAAIILPLFLLIVFQETRLGTAAGEAAGELFANGGPSNRQLQAATLLAGGWALWLALRTRTVALAAAFTALATLFHLSLLTDAGLRTWLEEGLWDRLALYLVPLLVALAIMGCAFEKRQRAGLAKTAYCAGAAVFVLVLELLSLNGKAFAHLGITLAPLQPRQVSNPLLLDTLAAMCLAGLLIYAFGRLLDRHGAALLKGVASLLFAISPPLILEPLGYLVEVGEYSRRFDWLFLALALTITLLSHFRQRKSFYYTGLVNCAAALWLISDHYQWFDDPAWAMLVAGAGLVALVWGYGLDSWERRRVSPR